jgi:outer membrane protein W
MMRWLLLCAALLLAAPTALAGPDLDDENPLATDPSKRRREPERKSKKSPAKKPAPKKASKPRPQKKRSIWDKRRSKPRFERSEVPDSDADEIIDGETTTVDSTAADKSDRPVETDAEMGGPETTAPAELEVANPAVAEVEDAPIASAPQKAAVEKDAVEKDADSPGLRDRFYARAAVLHLVPFVNSGEVVLSNLSDFAQIAVEEGPIAGSGADMDPVTIPALMVGYVLPWLDGHLSVETILGAPVTLTLKASGTMANESLAPYALDGVPTGVPALGTDLGTAKALPPILTAVYRFRLDSRVRPYLGLGVNYMHVYDPQITNPLLTEVVEPWLEVEDAVGAVFQGGVDVGFYGRFFANLDVKAIYLGTLSATVHDVYVKTPGLPVFEMARVGDASVDIDVFPVIVSGGVGAHF